jgi:hypothetical protein
VSQRLDRTSREIARSALSRRRACTLKQGSVDALALRSKLEMNGAGLASDQRGIAVAFAPSAVTIADVILAVRTVGIPRSTRLLVADVVLAVRAVGIRWSTGMPAQAGVAAITATTLRDLTWTRILTAFDPLMDSLSSRPIAPRRRRLGKKLTPGQPGTRLKLPDRRG